jgi:hypothetical protein
VALLGQSCLLAKLSLRYYAKTALLCFESGDTSLSVCLSLRSRTVEHLGDLFKTSTLGLREQEPDDGNEGDQAANVDEVVPPRQSSQSDRVEVLIEHTGRKDRRESYRHSARAQTVRQDLDRVGKRQWREGDVIEAKEDEEHGDDGASDDAAAVLRVYGTQSCDDGECEEHADGAGEPQWTAAVTFCGGCADES